jgi:steroid delta-isomerase-like uncharacterized protein
LSASDNRDLVRRWIEDGWNGDDNERVMREVFAEDWVDGDDQLAPGGWEGMRQFVNTYRAALPDVRIEVHEVVADEDFVAFRWTARGTHLGALLGVEPTSRQLAVTGHTMHRVRDGCFQESWVQIDALALMSQLGLAIGPQA